MYWKNAYEREEMLDFPLSNKTRKAIRNYYGPDMSLIIVGEKCFIIDTVYIDEVVMRHKLTNYKIEKL